MREKQRRVVNAIAAASPASGWQGQDDALGWYVQESLLQHMLESVDAGNKHQDTEAHAWLEHSEDVLGDHFVKCAADCLGVEVIMKLAEQHEAKGELWLAAKRYASAAYTVLNSNQWTNSDADQENIHMLKKAAELLALAAPQTPETRTLEVALRLRMAWQLGWNDPWNAASLERIGILVDAGVKITSMDEMWRVGVGLLMSVAGLAGYTGSGASNRDDIESLERAWPGYWNGPLYQAAEGLDEDDESKLICFGHVAMGLILPHFKHPQFVEAQLKVFTHDRLSWMIHTGVGCLHREGIQRHRRGNSFEATCDIAHPRVGAGQH